ncbi:MAG: FHA domain-containing protein [Bdellovibrionaceae bacterium]|nr:FHA domain-containing protein [Bdellovibrionales bacterium]MCB9083711.1 FHA domain-containing protein [Pseudobdellovibrionaceae bacterium]
MKAFIVHQGSKKKLRIKKEFVIGRMDGDRTYPNDGRMSRSHCILRFDGELLTVEDLGSKNGTQIAEMNITPRTPVELVEGDVLTVGDQNFEILFKGKAKEVNKAAGEEGDATEILEAAPGEEYASQHDSSLDMTEPPTIKAPDLNFGPQADDLSRTEVVPESMDRTVVDSSPSIAFGKTGNCEFVNHPDLPKPDDEVSLNSSPSSALPGDQPKHGKSRGLDPMNESTFDPLSFEQEEVEGLPEPEKSRELSESLKSMKPQKAASREAKPAARRADPGDLDEEERSSTTNFLSNILRGFKKEEKSGSVKKMQNSEKKMEQSRINIPSPKKSSSPSSEEVVFARLEKPSIFRTILMLLLFLAVGPMYLIADPIKSKMLQSLSDPVEIVLWVLALIVPPFLIGIPIQTVRMRTGWTKGTKSFYLTAVTFAAILFVQMVATQAIETETGFDKKYFSAKVKALCIDAYKPDLCAQVVFQCPDCLLDFSFKDRKEFLESIYPTVEALTLNDEGAAKEPRTPASKKSQEPVKQKPKPPPFAKPVKKAPPPVPPEPTSTAREPSSEDPVPPPPMPDPLPVKEGEYPPPTILPEKEQK